MPDLRFLIAGLLCCILAGFCTSTEAAELLKTYGYGSFRHCATASDGARAVGYGDNQIDLFETSPTIQHLSVPLEQNTEVFRAKFSPDGNRLFSIENNSNHAAEGWRLVSRDAQTGGDFKVIFDPIQPVMDWDFLSSNSLLIVCSGYRAPSPQPVFRLDLPDKITTLTTESDLDVALAPDKKHFAFTRQLPGFSQEIVIADTQSSHSISRFPISNASTFVFTPDSQHLLVAAGYAPQIFEFDGTNVDNFPTQNAYIEKMSYSPDGLYMIMLKSPGELIVFDVATKQPASRIRFPRHAGDFDLAIQTGKLIVLSNNLNIRNLPDLTIDQYIVPPLTDASQLALSPDGMQLAISAGGGTSTTLIDVNRDVTTAVLPYRFQGDSIFGFCQSGSTLLMNDGIHALLINPGTGLVKKILSCPLGLFSGNGHKVFVTSTTQIKVYDTLSGQLDRILINPAHANSTVAVSYDGSKVVASNSVLRPQPFYGGPYGNHLDYYVHWMATTWDATTGEIKDQYNSAEYFQSSSANNRLALSGDGHRALVELFFSTLPSLDPLNGITHSYLYSCLNFDGSQFYTSNLNFQTSNDIQDTTNSAVLERMDIKTRFGKFSIDGTKFLAIESVDGYDYDRLVKIYDVNHKPRPVYVQLRPGSVPPRSGDELTAAWAMDLAEADKTINFELVSQADKIAVALGARWAPLGSAVSLLKIPASLPSGDYVLRGRNASSKDHFFDTPSFTIKQENAVQSWMLFN